MFGRGAGWVGWLVWLGESVMTGATVASRTESGSGSSSSRSTAGPLKAKCEVSDRTAPLELEGPQIILSRSTADGSLKQQRYIAVFRSKG